MSHKALLGKPEGYIARPDHNRRTGRDNKGRDKRWQNNNKDGHGDDRRPRNDKKD